MKSLDDLKIVHFTCEENLSKYVSSMLFDSGEEIARGFFYYNGELLKISLKICGEVSVTYKDEVYHRPSEFPDELIERIKKHPYDWDVYSPSGEGNDETEGEIYVGLNNWFEYIINEEGYVYEEDLSEAYPDMILTDMIYYACMHFGLIRR